MANNRFKKKIGILLTLPIICLGLTACGNNNQAAKENSSLKAENQRLKKTTSAVSVVGSYQDKSDGAVSNLTKTKQDVMYMLIPQTLILTILSHGRKYLKMFTLLN